MGPVYVSASAAASAALRFCVSKLLRSVHIDVRCADVSPVATNGIGTFVMGNCGCAFAPCDRGDRNFLIELMVSGCAKASS